MNIVVIIIMIMIIIMIIITNSVAPLAQLAKGSALRCRRSGFRIPDWAG